MIPVASACSARAFFLCASCVLAGETMARLSPPDIRVQKGSKTKRMKIRYCDRFCAVICGIALACGLFASPTAALASTTDKTKSTSNKAVSAGKKSTTRRHSTSRRGKRSKKTASWRRGQQRIDSDRAREIQEALIREHYLPGKASGTWDAASQRAMEKFQADNGWQTKIVPDSRALIKLGLGPNHDHLLNPESAMTGPIPSRTAADRTNSPGPSAITPVATDPTSASSPQR